MYDLFNTSGHFTYIVAAFGFSTFILILNFWLPIRQKRKLTGLLRNEHSS